MKTDFISNNLQRDTLVDEETAPKPKHQVWEYDFLYVGHYDNSTCRVTIRKYGELGWELVTIHNDIAVFKRLKL